jgi:hypothetical protein
MWLSNAWIDYLNPQLYWKIDAKAQSFPVLLKWWTEQNPQGRHMWPGMTIRGNQEVTNEIAVTRNQPGVTGHVIFHAVRVTKSTNGLDQAIADTYAQPVLIPPTPWLGTNTPAATELKVKRNHNEMNVTWKPIDEARWWVLQQKFASNWVSEVLPPAQTNYIVKATNAASLPQHVYISAVNRLGNVGPYAAK